MGNRVYLCGTLGSEFDRHHRARAAVSAAEAYEIQMKGLAEIEKVMDDLETEIRATLAPDETLLPRRSPGYGEMPLALSREIIEALDATKRIGVSLTDSLLLVPSKSVTAICEISSMKSKITPGIVLAASLSAIAFVSCGTARAHALNDRLSATGDYRLPEKANVVADAPGYNSWPMVQAMGDKLICSYSRDSARPRDGHSIDPGSRDSYMKFSLDCGRTWSAESSVANDPKTGEVNEGIGLDATGATLLWVRCRGKDLRHELYRTTDGKTVTKIATVRPDPMPMQVMDPVHVTGLGLVSPWFAGNYRKGGANSWGLLISADDGHSWTQRVIEDGLSVKEWVTEPSLADLGNGRLLVIGRCEQNLGNQFQVTSEDGGRTWKKARTNIADVRESTPSLVYDRKTGLLANYYYHRGARQLKRRVAAADFIFSHPNAWPEPEILDTGFEARFFDAGNVKATRLGDLDCCAWYTGTSSNATVVVTTVPKPASR